MQRVMLKSKIHRATVTDANVDYEGSIAIDEVLLEEAGILPYEQVQVYNITNGERFTTYAIEGERGSGMISVNGAAARLASKGDMVIVASYSVIEDQSLNRYHPILVYVDENNDITNISAKVAGKV